MQRKYFTGSITKKLTIAYMIFIVVPITLICIYNYSQVQYFIKKQVRYEGEKTIQKLVADMNRNMEMAVSIGNNISYNEMVQQFLSDDFRTNNNSLHVYSNEIYQLMFQNVIYNKTAISQAKIFMKNQTIPEGYGYFYSEDRIEDKSWYKEFIKSDTRSMWVRGNSQKYFNINTSPATDLDTFIYLQKITNIKGTHLGILTLEMNEEDFLQPILTWNEKNKQVDILNQMGESITGKDTKINDRMSMAFHTLVEEKLYSYEKNGYNYMFTPLKDLGMNLVISQTQKEENIFFKYSFINVILLLLGLIISVVIFYIFLQSIFTRMRKNIQIVSRAVQEDMNLRVPVKGSDEIAMIATNFNTLIEKNNALIKDIVKREVMQKTTQLKALQFQINPHFFYNTLDILASKMMISGQNEIAETVADFGKMLRYNIGNKSMYTTIEEELKYVRQYIGIQRLKYNDRLKLDVEAEEGMKRIKILKFILQPIIENSIIHGFSDDMDTLKIKVDIHTNDKMELHIIIVDNGKGMEEDVLKEINNSMKNSDYPISTTDVMLKNRGIGLENINERLKLFYGETYHIRLESRVGQGAKTIMIIPMLEDNE